MNAKEEMKKVRNFLRRQVKMINNDPYLKHVHGCISARIVKWKASQHQVLVCVRNITKPETPWDSHYCRWVCVNTHCDFWKNSIWKELNEVVVLSRP